MAKKITVNRPKFSVWKHIKLGTHKSLRNLVRAITNEGCFIGDDETAAILKKIVLAPAEVDIPLVNVTARDLGLDGIVTRSQIYCRAVEFDLNLVPAEGGPQLRRQYLDQPMSHLFVAMEPIVDQHGLPQIFKIRCSGDGISRDLATSTCNAGATDLWDSNDRWTFTLAGNPA